MTASVDESVRCRCGRSTYLVSGYDSLRTCSKCGYLSSYCWCPREANRLLRAGLRLSAVGDRTREMLGVALVSSIGTLFIISVLSSPFVAIFSLGMPFGLSVAFFCQWLRDRAPAIAVSAEGVPVSSRPLNKLNTR